MPIGLSRTTFSVTKLLSLERKTARGLRQSTISALDFSVSTVNAAPWCCEYSTEASFVDDLGEAVQTLVEKGYETFKSGSCFADLAATRTGNVSHYDPEFFLPDQAIVIPVLFTNDIDGAACESHANRLPRMVNVRKEEGNGATGGFARKEFVFSSSSPYSTDSCARRFDEEWSSDRPGIIYIIPTRFATVAEFKNVHLSRYKRKRLGQQQPKKTRSDKGLKHKIKKTRSDKGTTGRRKPRSDKGTTGRRKPRSDKGTTGRKPYNKRN